MRLTPPGPGEPPLPAVWYSGTGVTRLAQLGEAGVQVRKGGVVHTAPAQTKPNPQGGKGQGLVGLALVWWDIVVDAAARMPPPRPLLPAGFGWFHLAWAGINNPHCYLMCATSTDISSTSPFLWPPPPPNPCQPLPPPFQHPSPERLPPPPPLPLTNHECNPLYHRPLPQLNHECNPQTPLLSTSLHFSVPILATPLAPPLPPPPGPARHPAQQRLRAAAAHVHWLPGQRAARPARVRRAAAGGLQAGAAGRVGACVAVCVPVGGWVVVVLRVGGL